MEADGRVYIDTEIQTDGFEAGSKDIELAARRMAKTVNKIGESAKVSLQKQTDAFVKQNQMLAKQKSKVEELENEFQQLSEEQINTEAFQRLEDELITLQAELDNVEKKQEEWKSMGFTNEDATKKAKLEYEKIGKKIDELVQKQEVLEKNGKAYRPADTSKVESKLAAEKQKLQQMTTALGTSYDALKLKVTSYGGKTEKLVGIKAKLINAFKRFGNAAKNAGKKLLGLDKNAKKTGLSMKRMLATSILMGVAFRAFTMVIEGVKTGMNNLAKYSKDTNADLSALKSSLTRLKNSFATAFAPLLSVVMPILTKFLNLVSKVITYIGMLGAVLSGKTTFEKAVEVQEDYASSLEDTAAGAEDAKKAMDGYLSPLDEINKMDSKDVSTGSGGGSVPVEDMFETEEIDSNITNLAEKLKARFGKIIDLFKNFGSEIKESTLEWAAALDSGPLVASLDNLLAEANPLIEIFLNGLAWGYENVLLPFGKWTIEKGLPALINALAKAFELVVVVLELLNPLFMHLWKEILVPFGEAIEIIILATIDLFTGLADFLIGIFTGDWERAFAGFQTILSAFLNIVNAVFGYIEKVILIPFDEFLNKVFTTDWTIAFGVMGEGLNAFFISVKDIWDGIKDILKGIITFINGVFKGDWKKAWEGIKQVFKGILTSMVGIVKFPINGIIAIFNSFISGMVAGINAIIKGINKISFKVPDWVPEIGGKSVGFNISTVTAPSIPYLAKGAVIPPNAPFVAMLGDQRQGTNIETPEKLLRQIMREELGKKGSSGTYKFIGQINRRVLFEEIITEAKIRQGQNGRNPFELA